MSNIIPPIQKSVSLAPLNTLAVPATARFFVEINSLETLEHYVNDPKYENLAKFILGDGSNTLFTQDINGLVLKNALYGIDKIKEDSKHAWLKIGAGESWHNIVMYTIEKNLYGIENLSLIPGSVGAAPVQNIGAYGVELSSCLDSLEAYDLVEKKILTFSNQDCQFSYRKSFFKQHKNRYLITSITLKLKKTRFFNIEYKLLKEKLKGYKESDLNLALVSNAVIEIRQSKLPDPKQLANAGSFFKNPIVDSENLQKILENHPKCPHYRLDNNQAKLAAGWLIEQCGFKGKQFDHVGMHEKQALVLINYGGATGKELLNFSKRVQQAVMDKFNIMLEPEVNII